MKNTNAERMNGKVFFQHKILPWNAIVFLPPDSINAWLKEHSSGVLLPRFKSWLPYLLCH